MGKHSKDLKANPDSHSASIKDKTRQHDRMPNIQKKPRQNVPAVNFHLLLACNMACTHCFASNLAAERLPVGDAGKIVWMISRAGFEKINFAGGEPMLHSGLDRLIRVAKENGMTTCIVTNGTRITDSWLDGISKYLDWIALSVDSDNPETHKTSGRAVNGLSLSTERYLEICRSIKQYGIRLKINTVVTDHNRNEDMTAFIREAGPERWKIMQALPIEGQNDHNAGSFEVTDEIFKEYVRSNRSVETDGILVVPEGNDLMTGSYVMIDPMGCFFDNTQGRYAYSRPILKVGVVGALRAIKIEPEVFDKRGGRYDW